jgi:hypothetical protein
MSYLSASAPSGLRDPRYTEAGEARIPLKFLQLFSFEARKNLKIWVRSVKTAVGRLWFPFEGRDRPEIGFVPSEWQLAGCGSRLKAGIDLKLGLFRQNGSWPVVVPV